MVWWFKRKRHTTQLMKISLIGSINTTPMWKGIYFSHHTRNEINRRDLKTNLPTWLSLPDISPLDDWQAIVAELSPRTCWRRASLWYVQSIPVCGLQHENWWSSKIRNHALGWKGRWNLLQPWMLFAAHCLSTPLGEQGRLPPILTRPSASSIIHLVFNMLHTHSVWGYNHAKIFVWD